MRVDGDSLIPALKSCDSAWKAADKSLIKKKVFEGFPGSLEHELHEKVPVVLPQGDKLMGHGKNDMVIVAGDHAQGFLFKPLFVFNKIAHRAGPVMTGIKIQFAIGMVRVWADVVMIAHLMGPATADCIGCFPNLRPDLVLFLEQGKKLFENSLNDSFHNEKDEAYKEKIQVTEGDKKLGSYPE